MESDDAQASSLCFEVKDIFDQVRQRVSLLTEEEVAEKSEEEVFLPEERTRISEIFDSIREIQKTGNLVRFKEDDFLDSYIKNSSTVASYISNKDYCLALVITKPLIEGSASIERCEGIIVKLQKIIHYKGGYIGEEDYPEHLPHPVYNFIVRSIRNCDSRIANLRLGGSGRSRF